MNQPFDDPLDTLPDEPDSQRPTLLTILILLLLIVAMLATLVWPIIQSYSPGRLPPTPTSSFLQEA
ncbi:MAG: hypothetical protein H6632_14185 [Anaerolineales bacterium]|nr:hypothetical protein [Anaerolineales bacterium]